MQKLYLVGFTSDLRNLILSRQKGVKSGGFMVAVDDRLRRAIEEVTRLQVESRFGVVPPSEGPIELSPDEPVPVPPADLPSRGALAGRAPRSAQPPVATEDMAGPSRMTGRTSLLTPKEIQAQLRSGVSVADVARMAGTDVAWIERFLGPILAEREGIVEGVKGSIISRPRLGRSGVPVGQAIAENLRERKLIVSPEQLDEGWRAVRRAGSWEVTFRYTVRGQIKDAHFGFDVDTRVVKALNQVASQIGWRPGGGPSPAAEASESPESASPARSAPVLAAKPSPAKHAPTAKPNLRPAAQVNSTPRGRPAPASRRPLSGGETSGPPAGPRPRSAVQPVEEEQDREPEMQADAPVRKGPSPRGAGPSDERRSFARSSSSPRPRRLLSEADGAEWAAAVASKRATRTGAGRNARGPELTRQSQPRLQKKRLPDNWLTER